MKRLSKEFLALCISVSFCVTSIVESRSYIVSKNYKKSGSNTFYVLLP